MLLLFGGAIRFEFGKGLAGLGVSRIQFRYLVEALNDRVAILGVELDAIPLSPGSLGGNESGAAAGEGIEHDAATLRAIENRVGDEPDGLYRRV